MTVFIIFFLLLCPPPARAAELEGRAADAANAIDTAPLEQALAQLDEQYAAYLEGFSLSGIWRQLLKGERQLDFSLLADLFTGILWSEVAASGGLLAQLLILSLLSLLLSILKDSFAGGEVAAISRWVVYLLLLALAVAALFPALQSARDTVRTLGDFMFILLPVLMPLLAALGGVGTVALISPALLIALNLLMALMGNVVFPLIYFNAVLRLIGQMTPRFQVSRLAALCKDAALGLMSVMVTLFIAFLSFSGLAAASSDGLAIKAVKTASGAFIPVVGRSLADALDSVLGTALLVKNSIGLVGALALLLICALPALRLLAQALIFRLAGAIVQPLGEEQLSEALSGLGNALILLFAALAISGLFAFFALALVVGLGNLTMMMR